MAESRCQMCGAKEGQRMSGHIDWTDDKGKVIRSHGKIHPETGECRPCRLGREMAEKEDAEKRSSVFRDRRGG